MSGDRKFNYRAYQALDNWRGRERGGITHESLANALGKERGAKGLFFGQNEYWKKKRKQFGQPSFVVIWESGANQGLVVMPDPVADGELLQAAVPMADILRFDAAGGASKRELRSYFSEISGVDAIDNIVVAENPEQVVVDEYQLQNILSRRGQKAFREKLLTAYQGCCAVTGCAAEAVLEAAHIVPHSKSQSYDVTNGILLRADIHTLFDLLLLSIDPSTGQVRIVPELRDSYPSLDGTLLRLPNDSECHPSPSALLGHFSAWRQNMVGGE